MANTRSVITLVSRRWICSDLPWWLPLARPESSPCAPPTIGGSSPHPRLFEHSGFNGTACIIVWGHLVDITSYLFMLTRPSRTSTPTKLRRDTTRPAQDTETQIHTTPTLVCFTIFLEYPIHARGYVFNIIRNIFELLGQENG
ncbi:uncharacterized protein M6B38_254285 [Iris pallida]|uniref:Uncharacterized protein n=1 Tax=Iris pallida TaxID=29817 RepID=A0AAX6IIE5_IRIPA|nr:uncharacterized protein M6B38_254285 [Iris pallida]